MPLIACQRPPLDDTDSQNYVGEPDDEPPLAESSSEEGELEDGNWEECDEINSSGRANFNFLDTTWPFSTDPKKLDGGTCDILDVEQDQDWFDGTSMSKMLLNCSSEGEEKGKPHSYYPDCRF